MKYISSLILIWLLVMPMAGTTQTYNSYQTTVAKMIRTYDDLYIESNLTKVVLTLSHYYKQINVRIPIPKNLIIHMPPAAGALTPEDFIFSLTFNIAEQQIQDAMTSTRVFKKVSGLLSANGITKTAQVEYTPLPAGPDQDGDFNLSMIIRLNVREFFMDDLNPNSLCIIKISDAKVNRE